MRVMFFVDIAQVLVGDMGVDLGGRDITVAEQGLDAADVGAIHQQVSGVAVAHSVRSDFFGDAS